MFARSQSVRLVLSGLYCLSLSAQETRATLLGRVTDPSGAVVAGAKVEALNLGTNTALSAASNSEGNFTIPYLLSGQYRVTVEMAGFKKSVREPIQLRASERITLDFALEIGGATESVVVTAEAPQLEQSTASVSMTIDAIRASELPRVGGNPYYFTRIAAGMASTGGRYAGNAFDYGSGSTDTTVNGTRTGSNEVQLDGSPNMFRNNTAYSLPEDLVQEMKVQTTTYDATMGHAAGALVNISMKSGTNDLHGTAYMFDSRLRAIPWHTNKFIYDPNTGAITPEKIARNTPGWLHQRWGGTLSGPLVIPKLYNGKNKTFWSFGYEGLHILRNLSFTGTMPTEAEKSGNFASLLAAGATYQIYDPFTTVAVPGGQFQRQPIPGNIIPSSRIDPVAKKIQEYWVAPNQPGSADGRNNFFSTQNINRNNWSYVGRLDHTFSEKHRIFARLNNNYRWELNQNFPSLATGSAPSQEGYGGVLDDVYVFSPNLLLNTRYSLSYQNPRGKPNSLGFDLTTLGLPQSLVDSITKVAPAEGIAFPQVVVDTSAFTNLGDTGGDTYRTTYQTVLGTVTQLSGNHSMRYGAEFRSYRETGFTFGNVAPRYEFANTYTRGPLNTAAGAPIGQGYASFLLGVPTGGYVSVNDSRAIQTLYSSFFFQDDWKLTRKLTVNLGLRYEYESPLTERFDRTVRGYDFAAANPVEPRARIAYAQSPIPELTPDKFRVPGGLTFAGKGIPRTLWNSDRNNFAPRIGLAYTLSKRTVVRAGYGFFYDVLSADRVAVNQAGYSQNTNIVPTLDNGITYRASFTNPFPDGFQLPVGNSLGLKQNLGRAASFFQENPRNPYMQRWSFTVQHELPSRILIEAGYVGNRGTKLQVTRELGAIPRQYQSTSPVRDQATIDFLAAQYNNPFANMPEFLGTGLYSARTGRGQLLRAYPHFTGVSVGYPAGYSYYHGFQFQMEKRFTHGVTFQASYTYSKFMEARAYLNETDSYVEKVVSDQDYPQRLVLTGIYELPLGRGRHFGSDMSRWLDLFLGGWQLQGWYEGQAGQPLGFGNAILYGSIKDVPLPKDQRSTDKWFNTSSTIFERSTAKALASNIRTVSTRFSGVRADGINNLDASFFKTFTITEKYKAQFRMEAFNSLNHVQFGDPVTDPYNTSFGIITGERGHGQRQITFALKLIF